MVQAGAISPQFMFLQLYQAAGLTAACTDKPLLLPNSKSIESSLKILDRIFCYETHKVGVVYVGHGQVADEQAILRNQFGSSRYASFLSGLGTLVDITVTDQSHVFLGGLDPRDDGQFHIVWQDDALQASLLLVMMIHFSLYLLAGCVPHGHPDAQHRVGSAVQQEEAPHR